MSTSFVYFLKSECFNDDVFKLVISRCTPEDILTAHRDIYCSKDEGREPLFQITESIIVHDQTLFNSYRAKLTTSGYRKDFYDESERSKLKQLLESVNSLAYLVNHDDGKKVTEDDDFYEDLIVTEEVANFEQCNVDAFDESTDLKPDISDNRVVHSSFVPMTRLLHIQETADSQSFDDTWSPMYNPFIIYNRGYGYLLEPLRNIFPEFIIDIHDQFPKIPLAEDMLWYQLNELYPEDDDAKFNTENVKTMLEKIRIFFDCSLIKKVETHNDFLFHIPPEKQFNVLQNVISTPTQSPQPQSLPLFGATPLPFQPVDHISNNFPWCPPTKIPMNQCMEQPIVTTEHPSFINMPMTKPYINDIRPLPLPNQSLPHQPLPHQPLQNRSEPFLANNGKETIWNNETKKEITDVTVHAEKRILLKEFVDNMCHQFQGSKVKSSKLFEIFKEFYNTKHLNMAFEKAFNQTSFTCIMKEVSIFHTKREKDGMYWVDLHVGHKPEQTIERVMKPKETKIKQQPKNAMVDFAEGDDKEHRESITLAEILRTE